MPYKNEGKGLNIPESEDRRRKLSEAQKAEIRELYTLPDWSQRRLAGAYGVSRRLIQFVLDPEKIQASRDAFRERQKDGRYYDREKHTDAVRATRQHRRRLELDGLLSPVDRDSEQK